jgi:hypothetical protein
VVRASSGSRILSMPLKWIPLEADCNLEYENAEDVDMDEVLQWKHMHSYSSTQIYFDPNNKSSSGKMMPM